MAKTAKKVKNRSLSKSVKRKAKKANSPKKSARAKKYQIPIRVEGRLKKQVLDEKTAYFHLKNGRMLKSIYDLAKNLERMSEEVFSYHVTPYKNDFSAWLYHAFGQVELARRLANEKNKKTTFEIIIEYFR